MKCLLLGDKGCGKNSLALTFLLGKCPDIIPSNSFNRSESQILQLKFYVFSFK